MKANYDTEIKPIGKMAAFFATIWLIMHLDTFYTWLFSDFLVLIGSSLLLFIGTILQFSYSYKKIINNRVLFCLVILICYILYLSFITHDFIFPLLRFGPLILFFFWDIKVIEQTFFYFRNFILFYAAGAIVISILIFTGYIDLFPYFILPSQDAVQENMLSLNRIYGIFVVPDSYMGISYRAGGPFREGGHFAIYLGIVYFIESCVYDRKRLLLIIAGILTFSSVFILLLIVSFFYNLSKTGNLSRGFALLSVSILIVGIIFLCLPSDVKDQLIYLAFERSLSDTIEQFRSEGLMAALDTRTNKSAQLIYDDFISNSSFGQILTGAPVKSDDEGYVLSDFRLLIYLYGLISLFFVLMLIFSYSGGSNFYYRISLLFYAILILVHRAWMFKDSYIFFLMFLATSSRRRIHSTRVVSQNQIIHKA